MAFDPLAARKFHRLISIYTTATEVNPSVDLSISQLYLGRLEPHYAAASSSFPVWIARADQSVNDLWARRWDTAQRKADARRLQCGVMLCPDGVLAFSVALDVAGDKANCIQPLEDLYYHDLCVGGVPIDDILYEMAGPYAAADLQMCPEQHQLVFLSTDGLETDPADTLIPQLIYRSAIPTRSGMSSIAYPLELNRNIYTLGAVGPYVSVLAGHQDYVENAAFLSAVLLTNAAARLREIRGGLLSHYRTLTAALSDDIQSPSALALRAARLGEMSSSLGEYELDLSFRVEAHFDIGAAIPSLRPDSFHSALADSSRIVERSRGVAGMLQRLNDAVRSKSTAVAAQIAADSAHQRSTWELTAILITTIAVPIGGFLAFFGVSAAEVDPEASLFDFGRYWGIYLFTASFVIASAGFVLLRRLRVPSRRNRSR